MTIDGFRLLRARDRGQQPRERPLRAYGERGRQLRAAAGKRLERLHHRRIRGLGLVRVAGAAERVEVEFLGLGEQRLDLARLADPGRPGEEERATVAVRGPTQRGGRRRELSLTSFDAGVQDARRTGRRPAQELALELQRLSGRLRPEACELVLQQPELA